MPIGDLLASISGDTGTTLTTFSPSKRRAEDDLRLGDKVQRTQLGGVNSARALSDVSKRSAVSTPQHKPKTLQHDPIPVSNSKVSTSKNGRPTPPPTNGPTKALKKGSFAEIMARGKAAQTTLGQIGKIQHKKIEKVPSRRERGAMLAQKGKVIEKRLDNKGKLGDPAVGSDRSHQPGAKLNGKEDRKPTMKQVSQPEKRIKKAATATTGYAGTARPKTNSNQYDSRTAAPLRERDKYSAYTSRNYDHASEEEDEEVEEEEEGYSDGSDMEAAAFEVDEEEELAARIARHEDAEALAEENRHKREKLEKKKRLEALARKAPGQRY